MHTRWDRTVRVLTPLTHLWWTGVIVGFWDARGGHLLMTASALAILLVFVWWGLPGALRAARSFRK